MALACSGKVSLTIQLTETNAQDLSTPKDDLTISKTRTITSGTGANQDDLLWHDQRILTNGATEALSLHDGTLTGAFGAITFDKLKGICLLNYSTENSLQLGASGATAVPFFANTSDILVLPPASATNTPSVFLFEAPAAAGLAVGTNEVIKFTHSGTTTNSLTYDIAVWGED